MFYTFALVLLLLYHSCSKLLRTQIAKVKNVTIYTSIAHLSFRMFMEGRGGCA